jgi:hypothetical protein
MLHKSEKRMYLTIGFGKIRRKAKPDEKGAVCRTLESGDETWAIEYHAIDGILTGIYPRQDVYGESYQVYLRDEGENYILQVKTNQRYCIDLLERIPSMNPGARYKFVPYDYEKDGKRRAGLKIEDENGEPVLSYYKEFEQDPEGKWNVIYKNGLQPFKGDWKDKDRLKIYFMEQLVFLKAEANTYLSGWKGSENIETGNNEDIPLPLDEDVPF